MHPKAGVELDFKNNYQLLVAVILSAQATDVSVNLVTKKLFKTVSTPKDLLKISLEALEEMIRTIGLWKAKAKNLRLMSQKLIDKFESQVPSDRDSLESLAGVGRKTASVVLNIAFKEPVIAVDTHVYRVSQRTGLAPSEYSIDKVANYLNSNTPPIFLMDAHHLLIFHGRYICKARKPECSLCQISDLCNYYQQKGN